MAYNSEMSDTIEASIKAHMSPIMAKLESIQRTVDLIKEDMDHDRKDFAEIKISQSTVERLTREIVDMYANIGRRVSRKAEEAVHEAIESGAQAVANLVEPAMAKAAKKIKNGEPLDNNRKHWWQFWK